MAEKNRDLEEARGLISHMEDEQKKKEDLDPVYCNCVCPTRLPHDSFTNFSDALCLDSIEQGQIVACLHFLRILCYSSVFEQQGILICPPSPQQPFSYHSDV